jgi:hypothetical protein
LKAPAWEFPAECQAGIPRAQSFLLQEHQISTHHSTGLAFFRLGNPKEGRRLHQSAIDLASEPEDLGLKTLGSLYLAREEATRGEKQAFADFKRAYDAAEKLQQTNIPALAEKLAKDVESAAERHHVNIEIRKRHQPIVVKTDFILRGERVRQVGQ